MNKIRSFFAAAVLLVALVPFQSAQAQPTVYNQPPGPLAQILGGPGGEVSKPTFAATVAVDAVNYAVQQINGVSTTSATCTVTAGAPAFGKLFVVIAKASAAGTVTYTFGTGFKSTGTAAPTAGTTIAVAFVGDGTNFVEFARSASAITY